MKFVDEILGEFILDPDEEDSYIGSFTIANEPIRLGLIYFDEANEEGKLSFLMYARQHVNRVKNSLNEIKQYACDHLLEIKNEAWLEDGELPTTAEGFIAQLKLEYVDIYANGNCSIHFKTPESLFWGHGVGVRLIASGDFRDVDIQ